MGDLDSKLIMAAEDGNLEAVKETIEKGADVNPKNPIRLR